MPSAPEDEGDSPEPGAPGAGPVKGPDATDGEASREGSADAEPVDGAADGAGPPDADGAHRSADDEGSSDGGDEAPDAEGVDEAPTIPERIHWKPVFSPLAIGMGALADVGFEVVLHQLGLALLTTANVLYQVAEGAALGIIAPSLGALIGAWWVNRKITKLEMELAEARAAEAMA